MIPNATKLQAISQMATGDLAEVPFPVLLHALSVYRRSTSLVIERRQVQKQIVLENGVPVDCQSNLLQDTLGKFMVSKGVITEEQHQEALAKSATSGKPFSDVLVEEKMVDANEVYRLSQQSLAKNLLDAFTWRSGTFHVSPDAPEVDSPLKVKTPQLVLTGISKFAPEAEIAEAMAPFEDKKLLINPRPPVSIKELRLSKDHQEILGLVSLGKTVQELVDESGILRPAVLRLLYGMAVIGLALPEDWIGEDADLPPADPDLESIPDMDFASTLPADEETTLETLSGATSSEPEGEAKAPPPRPARRPAMLEDVDQLRNEIMEAYLRYRKQDAFDLLGIEPGATAAEVDEAFVRFSEKMNPWNLKETELDDFGDKARDLFLAAARAFGELNNPETRKSVEARRSSGFQKNVIPEDARNAFAIKSNLLDSETQFKKGLAQMEAGRYQDAVELLQFAYDCEPQNSDYRAELAFCKYRAEPELERERSLEELRETIRIEPGAGLALYYAGMIYGESGEFQEAEPFLQKAIKLMKPDRRPIDALRTFKAAERERPKKKRRFF